MTRRKRRRPRHSHPAGQRNLSLDGIRTPASDALQPEVQDPLLVGARRPTVTGALAELAAKGMVLREPGRGWRLHGEPPGRG